VYIPTLPITLREVATNKTIHTSLTDSNGTYRFEDIPVGIYVVEQIRLDGLVTFAGPNNTRGATLMVTVTSPGLNSTNNNFISARGIATSVSQRNVTSAPSTVPTSSPSTSATSVLGSISGRVGVDVDRDMQIDTDLPNIPIILIEASTSQTLTTTLTDSNGTYQFVDIPPGLYLVEQADTSADFVTFTGPGDIPGLISLVVVTAPDLNSTGNDFINQRTQTDPPSFSPSGSRVLASILGTVMEDIDDDGIGEIGVENVVISLTNGSSTLTTVTASNGSYRFDVPPGSYRIIGSNQPGYEDVTTNMITISVDANETSSGNDFIDIRQSKSLSPVPSSSPTVTT